MRDRSDDSVKENSTHTIGVEFSSRTLRIGERNIKLQVRSISSLADNSYGIQRAKSDSVRSHEAITVSTLQYEY